MQIGGQTVITDTMEPMLMGITAPIPMEILQTITPHMGITIHILENGEPEGIRKRQKNRVDRRSSQ